MARHFIYNIYFRRNQRKVRGSEVPCGVNGRHASTYQLVKRNVSYHGNDGQTLWKSEPKPWSEGEEVNIRKYILTQVQGLSNNYETPRAIGEETEHRYYSVGVLL